jgi:hypothetical protein
VENEERRRRKNNIVTSGWRGEGKRKQQIKEEKENFIKENIEVKEFYNISTSGNEKENGKEKVMKQKEKLREKKETEKMFIDNDLTKQEREIQKKLRTIAKEEKREGKEVKMRYSKIVIERIQWRWNAERERLAVFQ